MGNRATGKVGITTSKADFQSNDKKKLQSAYAGLLSLGRGRVTVEREPAELPNRRRCVVRLLQKKRTGNFEENSFDQFACHTETTMH